MLTSEVQSKDNGKRKSAGEKAEIILDVDTEETILDFNKYVNSIFNIIKNSTPNFTIGIYGEWGTGKTTLMKGIEKKIKQKGDKKNPKIIPIWFNAWRYEREENQATIPLMKTIAYALDEYDEFKPVAKVIKKGLFIVGKQIMSAIVSKYVGNLDVRDIINEIKGEQDISTFLDLEKNTIYYDGLKKIKNALDTIRKDETYRVVIFIDDLDRCSPEKTLEVFESIKAFLDITGFVFVIGLSYHTTSKLIKKYYKDLIEGNDYIKKIIQVPIFVQEWNKEDIVKLFENLSLNMVEPYKTIFSNKKNIEILKIALEKNPRDAKRFINTFIISNEIYFEDTDNEKLLQTQCLKWRWQELYNLFSTSIAFRDAVMKLLEIEPKDRSKILDRILDDDIKKETVSSGMETTLDKQTKDWLFLKQFNSQLKLISNDHDFWNFISQANHLTEIKDKEWEYYRRASTATNEREHTRYHIKCSDYGFECKFVLNGETARVLIKKLKNHFEEEHGIDYSIKAVTQMITNRGHSLDVF